MRIGILLFNEVEELDFVGPLEVLGIASKLKGELQLVTVSKDGKQIQARYGLKGQPDCNFTNCPELDLLIIPGGKGARERVRYDEESIAFVRAHASRAKIASVCTGALVLAEAGILDGKKATTHWSALARLREYPKVQVVEGVRFVRDGSVATSAGISAGIDLALHIVRELHGEQTAADIAKEMEYLPDCQAPKARSTDSNIQF